MYSPSPWDGSGGRERGQGAGNKKTNLPPPTPFNALWYTRSQHYDEGVPDQEMTQERQTDCHDEVYWIDRRHELGIIC
jgi:hypothetical protein